MSKIYAVAFVSGNSINLRTTNGESVEYTGEEAAFILSGLPENYTCDDLLREVYGYEDMVGAWLLNEAIQGRIG